MNHLLVRKPSAHLVLQYRWLLFLSLQIFLLPLLPAEPSRDLAIFLDNHCVDCHDDDQAEGGLDLLSLKWDLADSHNASMWVKIHDRVKSKDATSKEESPE